MMFHICTIANDLEQYHAMKESFLQAGFDAQHCRYTLFDNSEGNRYEPYSALNTALGETTEPFLVFCHQDIRLDQGDGYGRLVEETQKLEAHDSSWAIAGNAGGTEMLMPVARITDPNGTHSVGHFPERVQTLDENFLLVKSGAMMRVSPELSGFHLYGTDLCFHAIRQGWTCYVIDFHLTHLSAGNFGSRDFDACLTRFCRHWDSRFALCLVKTTGAYFSLSRYALLRALLRSENTRNRLWSRRGVYIRLCRIGRAIRQQRALEGKP